MNHFATQLAAETSLNAPKWKQLGSQANRTKYPSLFNSVNWIEVLKSTYNLSIETSTRNGPEESSSEIKFCEINDARGGRIVSLPFCDYCDPQVSNFANWQALVEPIIARGRPTKFKVLRNSIPLADTRFEHRVHELWHATDLSKTEDELWSDIDESARRNIRKAERNGLTVRVGTTIEDVQTFYEMHVDIRKSKYGLLAQPIEFFENIHRVFSKENEIFVLLAEKDGLPLAGILFLKHEDSLYYKFNASRQTEYRPNDLLVWSGIRFGKERGLKLLDFGISALDQPGLVSFKKKFATEEEPVVQLTWTPQGYTNHQGGKVDELLARITEVLTSADVPPSVGQKASKLLYPFFI